jgi:hypothetical protein
VASPPVHILNNLKGGDIMNFLEALELCINALDVIQSGKRVQVGKLKLNELKSILTQIMTIIPESERSPEFILAIENLFKAIYAAIDIDMKVLPDAIKLSLEGGLQALKSEIANKAFSFFSINDFEPSTEIIELMRQVVANHYNVEVD